MYYIISHGSEDSNFSAAAIVIFVPQVWCHNLLSKVRGIIYTLAEEEQWHSSGSIRIQKVKKYLSEKETFDYEEALELHQSTFRVSRSFHYAFIIFLTCLPSSTSVVAALLMDLLLYICRMFTVSTKLSQWNQQCCTTRKSF